MRTTCINRDKSEKKTNANWEGKQVAKCSDAICAKFKTQEMLPHIVYGYIYMQQKIKNINMEDTHQLWDSGCLWAQEKLEWGKRNFHCIYNVLFFRKPSL